MITSQREGKLILKINPVLHPVQAEGLGKCNICARVCVCVHVWIRECEWPQKRLHYHFINGIVAVSNLIQMVENISPKVYGCILCECMYGPECPQMNSVIMTKLIY